MYAVLIFSKCHPVRSRTLLALSGCASVGLSIAVAYGFTALLGFKLNPVVQVLPFILIGIGVDDMYAPPPTRSRRSPTRRTCTCT